MSLKWALPKYKLIELSGKKNKYCLVIPVINEGNKFKNQIEKLKKFSKNLDIIIADGGSTDGSNNINFLKKNRVTALLVKNDLGKLSTQLRMAYSFCILKKYEGIITMDGNGKDSLYSLYDFINKLDQGYDYIQGSRFIKKRSHVNTPLLRYFAIRFIHSPLISLAARTKLTDTTNGYRAYSIKYLTHPRVQPFRSIFIHYELLAYLSIRASQLNLKTIEIPVKRSYPKGLVPTKITGISGYYDLLITLFKAILGKFNP